MLTSSPRLQKSCSWLHTGFDSLLALVYPPHCLHCQHPLGDKQQMFCSYCFEQFDLIDPHTQCSGCFRRPVAESTALCWVCRRRECSLSTRAAAFPYEGAPATLVKEIKYAGLAYLCQSAAAFLFLQLDRLRWPKPDLIVPVPLALSHWWDRGFNQSALIAADLAKLLESPCSDVLARESGGLAQAGLTRKQREQLDCTQFLLRDPERVHDQSILLVDDVMTSGATLERCADVLMRGYPKDIRAITVCVA